MTPRFALLPPAALAAISAAALLALLAAAPLPAQETTVYRCTDAGGGVTMQNKPCPAGTRQDTRTVGALPTAPPPTGDSQAPRRDQPPPGATFELVMGPAGEALPESKVPEAERVPPPTLYQCEAWDRDRYLSETGAPEPECVPLQTIGIDGSQQFGAGAACEMRRDTCEPLAGEALCKGWKRHVDEAAFRAKYADELQAEDRKAEYDRRARLLADSHCPR